MATREFTHTRIGPNARRIVWTGLLNGDDGTPFDGFQDAIRCIQVFGTFGAGGSLQLEASLEATSTTYGILHDTAGSDLTFTAARIEQVQEGLVRYRPRVTAGDGTTTLTVIVTEGIRGLA